MTVPTPTYVDPHALHTVTTDLPTLYATITAAAGRRVKAQWQVATDSGFTTNVRTITEPTSKLDSGGTHSMDVDIANAVFTGTWYIRVRANDDLGANSAWFFNATTGRFIVSHPATATNLNPDFNQPREYGGSGVVDFSWQFSDPNPLDAQTAFEIVVRDGTSHSVLHTFGPTSSPDTTQSETLSVGDKNIPLEWFVELADESGGFGTQSAIATFSVWDSPVGNITAPVATITTPTPTITWTFSAAGGRTQLKYKIRIYNQTTGGTLVLDTGWVTSAGTSYPVPPGYLHNSISYRVLLVVWDSVGLLADDEETHSTAWTPPAAPTFTIDTSNFANLGKITLTWTDAVIDGAWAEWRVYRRQLVTDPWTLIGVDVSAGPHTFDDYLGANSEYVVIQVKTVGGDLVESAYTNAAFATPPAANYWLIPAYVDNDGILQSVTASMVKLLQVESDAPTDEWETTTIPLIGRGRRTEFGTHFGRTGDLAATLWEDSNGTARAKRLEIEAVKQLVLDNDYGLYLRTPFGDLFKVSLGDLAFDHTAGTGGMEVGQMTIPYQEVF